MSKHLESLPNPVLWATPLFVLAILARKRATVAVTILIVAFFLPVVFACPPVASALERWASESVRDTVRADVQYDAAIVLSGSPEERIGAAADFVATGRARFLLYSGATGWRETTAMIAAARARELRNDQVIL